MLRSHPIAIDPDLHFTEHFARYGFAIVPGLITPDYCARALERIASLIGNRRPLCEWDTSNTPTLFTPYFEDAGLTDDVFEKLLDEPHLASAIHQLFGNPALWNHARNYYLFLRAFEPRGRRVLTPRGHIDFPSQPLPPIYRGFTFQAALADSEPFSGNITVHPRSQIALQKRILSDPRYECRSGLDDEVELEPPFEFVARQGDVLFINHLLFHSSNPSHAANRSPRVVIHAEAFSDYWPGTIDASDAALSPWLRSLAHNGDVVESLATQHSLREKRREYVMGLKKKAT